MKNQFELTEEQTEFMSEIFDTVRKADPSGAVIAQIYGPEDDKPAYVKYKFIADDTGKMVYTAVEEDLKQNLLKLRAELIQIWLDPDRSIKIALQACCKIFDEDFAELTVKLEAEKNG